VEVQRKTDGRRTDTRRRIHAVALEVFADAGYERGTLQQIADRLGITRPALYYHYGSKEEILAAIHDELAESVDEIIDWAAGRAAAAQVAVRESDAGATAYEAAPRLAGYDARRVDCESAARPVDLETRREVLRRLTELLRGPWGTFTRFARASEAALRDLPAVEEHTRRMDRLGDLLAPTADAAGRIKGRLALSALFLAITDGARLDATVDDALEAAYDLIDPRPTAAAPSAPAP
jgi:AcrR family transcriptional regulator